MWKATSETGIKIIALKKNDPRDDCENCDAVAEVIIETKKGIELSLCQKDFYDIVRFVVDLQKGAGNE